MFTWTIKMRDYRITADSHFWHDFLVRLWDRNEGFEEKIFKQLSRIPEDDVLIHLGDICMKNDKEWHEKYINPLKCLKILVKGNHDRKSYGRYLSNWRDFVVESLTVEWFGKRVIFTHIPTPIDGYLNIHGHLHMNKHHRPLGDDGNWDKRCCLYSQEFENYIPIKLQALLKKHKQRCTTSD